MIAAISHHFRHISKISFRNQSKSTIKKIKYIALNVFLNTNVATISYMTAKYVKSACFTALLLTISVVASAVLMAQIKY